MNAQVWTYLTFIHLWVYCRNWSIVFTGGELVCSQAPAEIQVSTVIYYVGVLFMIHSFYHRSRRLTLWAEDPFTVWQRCIVSRKSCPLCLYERTVMSLFTCTAVCSHYSNPCFTSAGEDIIFASPVLVHVGFHRANTERLCMYSCLQRHVTALCLRTIMGKPSWRHEAITAIQLHWNHFQAAEEGGGGHSII